MAENRDLFSPSQHTRHIRPPFGDLEGLGDEPLHVIIEELMEAYVQGSVLDEEEDEEEDPFADIISTGSASGTVIDVEDEEDEPTQVHTPPPPRARRNCQILSSKLSLRDFVEKMKTIGNGETYAAVTTAVPDDSIGFISYDSKTDILYITTPTRNMSQVSVLYIDKVRYCNSNGDMEVVHNKDSMVPNLLVLSYEGERFERVVDRLDGKIVHAILRDGENVFGVFRTPSSLPTSTVRRHRRPIREVREGMYEIQETPQNSHIFPANTLVSVEHHTQDNKVIRYQRVDSEQ